jgi:UDP-N-acetylmuramyl pentapeptide phosphotransferase/UDP-N-acetylglucosamine-1-phosphate transferase
MTFLPPVAAMLLACIVTRILVSVAPRLGLVDVPNERSLHTEPLATVGGLGVLLGASVAIGILYLLPYDDRADAAGLCMSAVLLLVLIRDEQEAMVWQRKLALQVGAALIPVWWMSAQLSTGPALVLPAGALLLIYTQNVYNFMDGLDGFSGLVGCVAGATLYLVFETIHPALSLVCLSVSAASLGFVIWNVPPARIFMGDVGSHYLGLFFGWVALTGTIHGVPVYLTLLPLGPFLFDASYTILRRVIRRENITRAHRFHLYQRLFRSGWSPIFVDGVYVVWTAICGAAAVTLQSGQVTWLAMSVAYTIVLTAFVEVRWARTEEDQ